MFNRCRVCGEKCPDFSDLCDTCCFIELSIELDELDYEEDEELNEA